MSSADRNPTSSLPSFNKSNRYLLMFDMLCLSLSSVGVINRGDLLLEPSDIASASLGVSLQCLKP